MLQRREKRWPSQPSARHRDVISPQVQLSKAAALEKRIEPHLLSHQAAGVRPRSQCSVAADQQVASASNIPELD